MVVIDNMSQNLENIFGMVRTELKGELKVGMIIKEKQVGPLV